MQRLIIISIFLISTHTAWPQTQPVTVPYTFTNTPFDEFVAQLEEKTPLEFYYQDAWVKDITVSTSGSETDIRALLTEILEPHQVNFMIDENSVILYPGAAIVYEIPDLKRDTLVHSANEPDQESALTGTELKYIEGKKESSLEVLKVGNQSQRKNGDDVTISGRIFDENTGEPLIGATVFIKELGTGGVTDLDGHFNLILKQGRYLMVVSSLSMREKTYDLQVYSDGTVSIPMERELVSINEVQIVAERNHNVTGIQMGYENISGRNIKEIPAVMGEKDILKVAQMLPGVQSAGEGASGLIVRGGSADQNLFYINKLPVYNTSHLFGFFSAFNPDIINNFSLYKSNIPAKYGGRVSSVFDIATRQGNKRNFFGKGGISPVTGHLAVEGPIVKDKSSFVLSYRGTYSDWLLSQVNDINIRNSNANFYDLSANVNAEMNENNLLKVFGYKSFDRFSLSTTNNYQYANTGGTISWKHKFSSSTIAEFAAIYSQYDFGQTDKVNPSEAFSHDYRLMHSEFKADLLYLPNNRHRISYGMSGIFYTLDRGKVLPYGSESKRIPVDLGIENAFEGAVHLSDEFNLLPRLTMLAGVRYSFYTLLGPATVNEYFPGMPKSIINIESERTYSNNEIVKFYSGLEPRAAFNYILGKNNSVKFSYNRLRQYIFLLSNTIAISPTDQWKLADYHLKPQVADQLSLGYYHNFNRQGLVVSAEVYKKWVRDVVEYRDGIDFISSDPSEMLLLQGKQDAYGAEFMLKKKSGKFTGWLSYSYSRSFIQVENVLESEQINNGETYPSNHDKPHSLNIVTNYKNSRRLSFSAILVYSTGRPITYPASLYYSEGREVLHYSSRNEYRIPDYFRVDFSINYEGNLLAKKWLHSSWMLNIYNVTGRKNAYSVYFEANEGRIQGYKLSIFGQPIITLSWNFKFGNYASE